MMHNMVRPCKEYRKKMPSTFLSPQQQLSFLCFLLETNNKHPYQHIYALKIIVLLYTLVYLQLYTVFPQVLDLHAVFTGHHSPCHYFEQILDFMDVPIINRSSLPYCD